MSDKQAYKLANALTHLDLLEYEKRVVNNVLLREASGQPVNIQVVNVLEGIALKYRVEVSGETP